MHYSQTRNFEEHVFKFCDHLSITTTLLMYRKIFLNFILNKRFFILKLHVLLLLYLTGKKRKHRQTVLTHEHLLFIM